MLSILASSYFFKEQFNVADSLLNLRFASLNIIIHVSTATDCSKYV